jgi:hypothetical protein
MNYYSIFDQKAGAYMAPFAALNDAVAVRMLTATARLPDNHLGQFPEDYSLFFVGTFDDEEGCFLTGEQRHVARLHELLANKAGSPTSSRSSTSSE